MNPSDHFNRSQNHHFDCLKRLFHTHYTTWSAKGVPISKRKRNDWWTVHLSQSVLFDIQLHLARVLVGKNTYRWSRLKIGKTMLRLFKQCGILNDLVENVRKYETVMNLYMEHELQ